MNNRNIEGNYVVNSDERFHGMVTGDVTVKTGVTFVNHGMLCNDVIVEKGGIFHNRGMVTGNVMGEGYAEIWCVVNGYVSTMLSSYIHRDAVVNGKRYEEDEKQM